MRFESQIRDGVSVVRLQGRFVTGSDAELQSVETYLRTNGITKAILDLSEVPYVDSTGLAFIVELHKSLQSRGGQLTLAGASARVREVLTLTHIGDIVPVFDDQEAAGAALQGEVLC